MNSEQVVEIAMKQWESGDMASAEKLLLQAAQAGSGLAAHNLGTLYAVGGPGIEQSQEKSRHWFEIALASGFEKSVASDPAWFRNAT
jgi:TPR repeat protein